MGLGCGDPARADSLVTSFIAWVPLVYWIARQFASATSAACVTLLAVTWSIPSYSAAVPSWYNLLVATAALAALAATLSLGRSERSTPECEPARRWR